MIPEVMSFDEGRQSVVSSFAGWYAAEYASVVRLARSLNPSWEQAEEVAQDAFLAAFKRWDRIGGYDDPSAWVRRVAINASLSRLRRASTEVRGLLRLAARPSSTLADHDGPDSGLWDAVRGLPRRQAEVLALIVVEDRSVREVAAILGCEERTVRTHLARGRATLAAQLGEPGDDWREVDDDD
jgi:RNA polymerase sigma-70 factor (ECF subfamily)